MQKDKKKTTETVKTIASIIFIGLVLMHLKDNNNEVRQEIKEQGIDKILTDAHTVAINTSKKLDKQNHVVTFLEAKCAEQDSAYHARKIKNIIEHSGRTYLAKDASNPRKEIFDFGHAYNCSELQDHVKKYQKSILTLSVHRQQKGK